MLTDVLTVCPTCDIKVAVIQECSQDSVQEMMVQIICGFYDVYHAKMGMQIIH